ncbi:MAG: KTSC domain-containing protein [Cytophagaceae bacterium]|nr:KTSC domain-containing protein [Cytophagaceae bacterium]
MRLRKINSRIVHAVGYDPAYLLLEVRFRISKKIYGFLNVPKQVYDDFMKARSKGQFFNYYIKNNYTFIEIKEPAH